VNITYSPHGTLLATASDDRTAKIWDISTGEALRTLSAHTREVYGIAFSPDGKCLATASRDKTVRVWDVYTGKEISPPFEGHADEVWGVVFSPDGKRLATASRDKTARVWDIASRKELFTLPDRILGFRKVAFHPDVNSTLYRVSIEDLLQVVQERI